MCPGCIYVDTTQGNCLLSNDFYSDSTRLLVIAAKQCTDISGRLNVCVCGSFNVSLNCRRKFMLCLDYTYSLSSVSVGLRREGLALLIGTN